MTDIVAHYSRIDLRRFHQSHPLVRFHVSDDTEVLTGLWESEDLRFFSTDLGDDAANILNELTIDSRFDAIIHRDQNLIEFVFAFLDPNDGWAASILERRFVVNFLDSDFECYFAPPSSRLLALARASRRLPSDRSDTVLPQIQKFRDFQRLDSMPTHVQQYFEGKQPRNFFVSISNSVDVDIAQLARHLNLFMCYYDRRSPFIVIRASSTTSATRPKPVRFLEDGLPTRITAREIEDVLLTLLEVAGSSAPRSAFLYYYQVFEYAGHYYIDDKTRRSLKRLLRDPALANCDDRRVGELFSILSDLHHHDEQRMQRVVEEHCDPRNLWPDVANDIGFFSSPVEFEGGLRLDRIASPNCTEDTWNDAFKSLFPVITRIRNCIVHAREKRESKVILPSKANNEKLARFIPLLRRMAEEVVIRA